MDIMRQFTCLVNQSRFIAMFPLKLYDGGSGLRFNGNPELKL